MIQEIIVANPPKRKEVKKMARRRKNAWYGDPEGHRRAALKGWETRRKHMKANAWYGDPEGHRRAALKGWETRRKHMHMNAWYGDPEGHRRAALKGWETRRRHMRSNPYAFGFGGFEEFMSELPPVNWKHLVGAALGGIAASKATDFFGVKKYSVADVLISAGSTAVGAYILDKVDEDAAFGFMITGSLVAAVKALRMILQGRNVSLMDEIGVAEDELDELIFGIGDDELEEELPEDLEDILSDEEESLEGDEVIIPTADF